MTFRARTRSPLAALILLAACSDTLTGPEAESVLRTIEQPALDPREARERLWYDMGFWEVLSRLRPASRVTVLQDGHKVEYSAIAFERVMIPTSGSGRSDCLGTRWSLFLWHEGGFPEGLVLSGGRFDRPLGIGEMCEDANFGNAQPMLVRYPAQGRGGQGGHVSTGGSGEIGPGAERGACAFLPEDAAAMLYGSLGVTCRLTRHRVRFDGELQPWTAAGTLGSQKMRVVLRPTEVIGVRYEVDCALPQAAEMCRITPSAIRDAPDAEAAP